MLVILHRGLAKVASNDGEEIELWCMMHRTIDLPIAPFPGLWINLEREDRDNRIEEITWDAESQSLSAMVGAIEVHADAVDETIRQMEELGWELEDALDRPPTPGGNGKPPRA